MNLAKFVERIFYPLLIAAALAGMALVVYATAAGPGVGGDATIYLTSARNLLEGRGLGWIEADGSFRMLPYTPPFYPLALSGVGLFAADLVAGARWLNVALFGLTVFLMGVFFYRFSGQAWLAVLLGGFLALSPVIVNVQVWAMSEPLFLLLGFTGLMLVLEYLERPSLSALAGAAVLCGLALLTRYIGVAFAAAGGLALLLWLPRAGQTAPRRPLNRLAAALIFGAIAALPMVIWLAVDFFSTGTVGSRSGQPASAYWQRFLEMGPALEDIYLFWLLPESVAAQLPGVVRVLLWLVPLAALAGLGWAIWRRIAGIQKTAPAALAASDRSAARMAGLFALFIVIYLAVLAVVHIFTYPPVTLASRMLSPVHFAFLVLVVALLHLSLRLMLSAERTGRTVAALAVLGILALAGSYTLRSALVARNYNNTGIGYMAPEWRDAPVLDALRELDPAVPIISNETTAVMFFADRPAYAVQEIFERGIVEPFTVYGQGDDEAQRVFREEGGALVLFNQTLAEDFARYGNRTDERIRTLTAGLIPYYMGEDGAIYFAPGRREQ